MSTSDGPLGRELRDRVGAEFRRRAEEEEHDARLLALRSRSLRAVAHELMSRGDRVEVTAAAATHRGVFVHVRNDLASLDLSGGRRLEVNLAAPVVVSVLERSIGGTPPGEPLGCDSFPARLRELELAGAPVTLLVTSGPAIVEGRLGAVAADHVMVETPDGEMYVSRDAIAGVVVSSG